MPTKEATRGSCSSSLAELSLALERGCLSAVGSVQSVAFFFFSRCCVTGNRNRGASAEQQTGASWAFKVRAMLLSTPSSTGTMATRSGFHSSFSAADWFHRLLYPTAPWNRWPMYALYLDKRLCILMCNASSIGLTVLELTVPPAMRDTHWLRSPVHLDRSVRLGYASLQPFTLYTPHSARRVTRVLGTC